MAKARLIGSLDLGEEDGEECSPQEGAAGDSLPAGQSVTRRVQVKKSPNFDAYSHHLGVRITVDNGAETNMIKASVAQYIKVEVTKSSQLAFPASCLR